MRRQDLRGAIDFPVLEEDSGAGAPVSTEVQLEIDLLKSASRTAQPRDVGGGPSESPALTLLVVDDDPDMRAYVKRGLRSLEIEIDRVLEAADGEEALARVRGDRVDLIISDVVMPRMDGLTLCRMLRRDERSRHIPVLLITGEMSEREARLRAREVQAQDVLAKPFNTPKLCDRVMHLLSRPPPA